MNLRHPQLTLSTLAAVAGLLFAAPGHAGLVVSVEAAGTQSSQVAGVTTENFDTNPPASDPPFTPPFTPPFFLPNGGNTSTAVGTIVGGTETSVEAQTPFGGAGGVGNYLRVNVVSGATLNLSVSQAYFGFWWSAADAGNVVELFSNGSLLGTFDAATTLAALGAAYKGNPNGQDDLADKEYFAYLNFIGTDGTTFDKVSFRNTVNTSAFEMDNFSIRLTAPDLIPGTIIEGGVNAVPEPTTLALVGLALAGIGAARRSKPAA